MQAWGRSLHPLPLREGGAPSGLAEPVARVPCCASASSLAADAASFVARMRAMNDVPTVLLHRDAAVATLTLRHAGRLNAMTRAMWRELRSAAEALSADGSLRCVVLRGEG